MTWNARCCTNFLYFHHCLDHPGVDDKDVDENGDDHDKVLVSQATVKSMLADIQARGEEGALEWAKKLDGELDEHIK